MVRLIRFHGLCHTIALFDCSNDTHGVLVTVSPRTMLFFPPMNCLKSSENQKNKNASFRRIGIDEHVPMTNKSARRTLPRYLRFFSPWYFDVIIISNSIHPYSSINNRMSFPFHVLAVHIRMYTCKRNVDAFFKVSEYYNRRSAAINHRISGVRLSTLSPYPFITYRHRRSKNYYCF